MRLLSSVFPLYYVWRLREFLSMMWNQVGSRYVQHNLISENLLFCQKAETHIIMP